MITYDLKKLLRSRNESGRGFNALYPVFTKEQIDRCERDRFEQASLYEALWKQIQDRDDFKVFVLGNELKDLMFKCALAQLEADHLRSLNSLQIEGNIAPPTDTPIYASSETSRHRPQDSGPRWSRFLLSRRALSSPTTCRFIPAHPDKTQIPQNNCRVRLFFYIHDKTNSGGGSLRQRPILKAPR